MHSINHHHAAASHPAQRLDRHSARRGKHHRGVQFTRGRRVRSADPRRPQLFGQTPVGLAARDHIHLAPPVPRHLEGQMRGGTEAKQAEPVPPARTR